MKTENKNEFADNVFRPNFNFKDYEKSAIKGFREVRAVPNAGAAQLFAVHLTTNKYKDAGILSGDIFNRSKSCGFVGSQRQSLLRLRHEKRARRYVLERDYRRRTIRRCRSHRARFGGSKMNTQS